MMVPSEEPSTTKNPDRTLEGDRSLQGWGARTKLDKWLGH